MEPWFIILISICISAIIKSIFNLLFTTRKPSYSLSPGPSTFPIIPNFLWLRKSSFQIEHSLRSIHAKFGPIVTLWIGFRLAFIVSGYLGVALASYVGVTGNDFSGFPLGLLIQAVCTLLQLFWSSWMPNDVKSKTRTE